MSIAYPLKLVETTLTPTLDTNAYASGDAIDVTHRLLNVLRLPGNAGVLKKVVIADKAKQSAALKLLFYSKTIATVTDNAAFDPTDTENLSFLGHVAIASTDYVALNDNCVGTVSPAGGYGLDLRNQYGRDIYVQIVSAGTPTFAAASDVQLTFVFEGV